MLILRFGCYVDFKIDGLSIDFLENHRLLDDFYENRSKSVHFELQEACVYNLCDRLEISFPRFRRSSILRVVTRDFVSVPN